MFPPGLFKEKNPIAMVASEKAKAAIVRNKHYNP